MRLEGVLLPVTTPFDRATGAIAPIHFRDNLRAYLAAGVHGFVVAGSTGEAPLLDEGEIVQLVEWARDIVPPEAILLAGTGAESTRATIRVSKAVAKAGADAVLVRPPSYYRGRMDPDTVRLHYEAVADAVPLPVVLYNVPKFVPVELSAGLLAELGGHANVAGIKDSSADLKRLAAFLDAAPPGCAVMVGAGSQLYAALEMGAAGGIIAVGCFAPRLAAEVYTRFRAGEMGPAGAAQGKIAGPNKSIVGELGVPGIKHAVELLGYYGGPPRSPLRPLSERDQDRVRTLLQESGLLAHESRATR